MPCTQYKTCPLFIYFSAHPILNLWRIHYCDKDDNSHCKRFTNTAAGIPNPVSLLPNGKQIELAPLALINAASKNRVHLIKNILANIDIDLDFQNIDGATALMLAARYGNVEAVEVLLKHGAKTDIKNYKNETAYDIAMGMDQQGTATQLRPYHTY
jgi:hypothetical protein